MTIYLSSPNIAVAPATARTVRIAAFSCEGLDSLSNELGFRVAVVAAVDDVARHAQRLRDLWYASGVPKAWDGWFAPFDFDNWSYREWRFVPLDPRWFGRSGHPLAATADNGTLALDLPTAVDRVTYASSFRDGLADLRFEAIARRPSFVVKWHHSRRGNIPASRYAHASAGDPTPTEVRDIVRLTPRDLPTIAGVALATLERLARGNRAATDAAGGL